MDALIWLVLAFPLLGVLLNGIVSHGLPAGARRPFVSAVGVGVVAAAFLCALAVFLQRETLLAGQPFRDFKLFDWIGRGGELAWPPLLHIPFAVRVDALSLVMMLVVTGVGALIHFYSTDYMKEDERYARYFTYLNLFTFAMLVLVMANNYLLMFVGWEGVGLCSYLLIGFWFDRDAPAAAGKKAFLVNRVGDWGFIVGMIALAWTAGTLTYSELFRPETLAKVEHARILGAGAAGAITLLLFIGATGKSAQLPLYLWLPDAMEGPTPVSALIHAATMVTAGVYMVARSAPLFDLAPETQMVVATVGLVTALFAALVAIVQYDIKRILAYSTVSQLGFMFIAVGVGAYAAGIAHLITHAFFKALLFLAAGSVMHALHGELDLRKMGGLAKALPVTAGTAAVGWLAISGFPPFSGFYSKDAILAGAFHYPGAEVLGWLALGVAAITAFYMTRFFLGTFTGPSRVDPHVHLHHETPVMNAPLVVLALLSLVGGWLVMGGVWPGQTFALEAFLRPVFAVAGPGEGAHGTAEAAHGAAGMSHELLAILSIVAMAVGVGAALLCNRGGWFARGWPEKAGWVRLLERRFYYDDLLHAVFVRGGTALCTFVWHFIDVLIIDGLVNATQKITYFFADAFRSLQTGYVRSYALVMLAGAAFVIGCFLWILQARPAGP